MIKYFFGITLIILGSPFTLMLFGFGIWNYGFDVAFEKFANFSMELIKGPDEVNQND